MALKIGTEDASDGMTKEIYEAMDKVLAEGIPADSLPAIREGWKKLSFAIASGVVTYLMNNLQIDPGTAGGDAGPVIGNTGPGGDDNHSHSVKIG
jgi:hypothetical protein